FHDGGANGPAIGSAATLSLVNGTWQASVTVNINLAAGMHNNIVAVYTPSTSSLFSTSTSSALSLTVNKADTRTTLTSSNMNAPAGSGVTITATVTGAQNLNPSND